MSLFERLAFVPPVACARFFPPSFEYALGLKNTAFCLPLSALPARGQQVSWFQLFRGPADGAISETGAFL